MILSRRVQIIKTLRKLSLLLTHNWKRLQNLITKRRFIPRSVQMSRGQGVAFLRSMKKCYYFISHALYQQKNTLQLMKEISSID